jgi:hypothetical protein
MSDPQHFLIHRFGPQVARDLSVAEELKLPQDKPVPDRRSERGRLRQVEGLVASALALTPAELRGCMVYDRYRFRISVYQQPAGAAVRKVFEDGFDRELYLWAYGKTGSGGVPSPVHGALLEILARRHLDARSREMLSGAWRRWNASRTPSHAEPPTMRR